MKHNFGEIIATQNESMTMRPTRVGIQSSLRIPKSSIYRLSRHRVPDVLYDWLLKIGGSILETSRSSLSWKREKH